MERFNVEEIKLDRLKKLRDWHKDVCTDEQFDMECFRYAWEITRTFNGSLEEYFNSCGTIGCALGNIYHAIPGLWMDKSGEVCIFDSSELLGIPEESDLWFYLFGGSWSEVEGCSSRKAAVERMTFIIDQIEGGSFDGEVDYDFPQREEFLDYMAA